MIGGPVLEEVAQETFTAVIAVGVVVPDLFLGTEVAVVVVEAVDELFAVDVAVIGFPSVPEVDVGIDDEVFFAVLLVHQVARSLFWAVKWSHRRGAVGSRTPAVKCVRTRRSGRNR